MKTHWTLPGVCLMAVGTICGQSMPDALPEQTRLSLRTMLTPGSVLIGAPLTGSSGPEDGLWSLGQIWLGSNILGYSGATTWYPPNGSGWMHIDNPGIPTGMLRFSSGIMVGASPDSFNIHVTQQGRIGIGVPFPLNRIDVKGGGVVVGNALAGALVTPPNTLWVQSTVRTGIAGANPGSMTMFPPNGAGWMHLDNPGMPTGMIRISSGNSVGQSIDSFNIHITQHGRIGVGVPLPGNRLDIRGGGIVVGKDIAGVVFSPVDGIWAQGNLRSGEDALTDGALSLYTSSGFNRMHIDNPGLPLGVLRFSTGNDPGSSSAVSNMYFFQNGSLSVGSDAIPAAKVGIYQNGSIFNPQILLYEDDVLDFARLSFGNSGTSDVWTLEGLIRPDTVSSQFDFYNSMTGQLMTLRGNGNLGIGTLSPVNKLDVEGAVAIGAELSGFAISPENGLHVQGNIQTGITASVAGVLTLYPASGVTAFHIDNPALNTPALQFSHGTSPGASSVSENMYFTYEGNLGIGTAMPLRPLHVARSGENNIRVTGSTAAGLEINRTDVSNGWLCSVVSSPAGDFTIEYSSNGFTSKTRQYQFWSTYFMPATDNTKSLGTSSNRWTAVYAANGTIQTSDAREKKNISPLQYGLNAVMQLKPVTYSWKSDDAANVKIGLVAQDVLKVLPEVVQNGDPGEIREDGSVVGRSDRMGIYYSDIIPVLIKGMQEQQAMITALQQEVAFLRSQLKE